jgi:hypothetical protein
MRIFLWLGAAFAVAASMACEIENPAADAGTDASVSGEAGALACGENTFPAIERSCLVDDDCAVVEHQINCCGTLSATGIRADAKSAFDAAEATCRASYPRCRCAVQITQADDGTSAADNRAASVSCAQGRCSSTFTPPDPGICTPGGAPCAAGFSCCYPCGIEGCDFRCEPTCAPGTPGCAGGCFLRP